MPFLNFLRHGMDTVYIPVSSGKGGSVFPGHTATAETDKANAIQVLIRQFVMERRFRKGRER